jgi:hypothetical protein
LGIVGQPQQSQQMQFVHRDHRRISLPPPSRTAFHRYHLHRLPSLTIPIAYHPIYSPSIAYHHPSPTTIHRLPPSIAYHHPSPSTAFHFPPPPLAPAFLTPYIISSSSTARVFDSTRRQCLLRSSPLRLFFDSSCRQCRQSRQLPPSS